MATRTAFAGRQAIYDRNRRVCAYELLYRDSEANFARFDDADEACRQTLLRALVDVGLGRLVGEHRAYVNLGREAILGAYPGLLPAGRVVLELLEDVTPDRAVLGAVAGWKAKGYAIALDDFVWRETHRALVELADVVKVDVRVHDPAGLGAQVAALAPFGVTLLAEKVETAAEYEACRELGFSLFQGFFLCRPTVFSARRVPAARVGALELLGRLQAPDISPSEIEAIICRDVSLSYSVLRYVNSSFYSLPVEIDSVGRAVLLLGVPTMRNWASLVVLSSAGDLPRDVLRSAIVRARMCELLARAAGASDPDRYFTVGLFSALDAVLGCPLEAALAELPLSEEVATAVLRRQGRMGRTLACALAYERGEWDAVAGSGFAPAACGEAFVEAVEWAQQAAALTQRRR